MAKDSDFFGAFRPRRPPDSRPRAGEEPRGAPREAGRPAVGQALPPAAFTRPAAAPAEQFLLAVEPPEPLALPAAPGASGSPAEAYSAEAAASAAKAGFSLPEARVLDEPRPTAPARPGGPRVWRASEAPDLATLSGAGRFVPPVPVLSASVAPRTAAAVAAPASALAEPSAAGGRKAIAAGARAEEDLSPAPLPLPRAATGRPGPVRAPAEAAGAAQPAETAERMIVLSVWEVLLVAVLVALLMGFCFHLGRRSGHPGLGGVTSTATEAAPADASVTPPPVPSAASANESGRSH